MSLHAHTTRRFRKAITPARHWQRRNDPVRVVTRKYHKIVKRELLKAFAHIAALAVRYHGHVTVVKDWDESLHPRDEHGQWTGGALPTAYTGGDADKGLAHTVVDSPLSRSKFVSMPVLSKASDLFSKPEGRRDVSVSELKTTQDYLNPEQVAEYGKPYKDRKYGTSINPIATIHIGGETVVVDGTHRLAAAIQRGDKTVETMNYGSFVVKDGQLVRTVTKAYNPDEPRDEHGMWTEGGAALTGPQRYRTDWYKANGYNYINPKLRSGEELSNNDKEAIKHLDAVTSNNALTEKTTLYRTISGKKATSAYAPGAIVTEPGYMSTSTSMRGATNALRDTGGDKSKFQTMLAIEADKGQRVGDLTARGPIGFGPARRSEGEILLGRGHTMTVTGTSDMGGVTVTHVTLHALGSVKKAAIPLPDQGMQVNVTMPTSHEIQAQLKLVYDAIAAAAQEVAVKTASQIARDVSAAAAEKFMADWQTYMTNQIVEVTAEIQASVQQIMSAGAYAGLSPSTVARDVRDMIGLTEQQQTYVESYRASLENLSQDALDRMLRSTTADRKVEAAIEDEFPLEDDYVDRLVARYAENWRNYRADMIARTELITANNEGARAGMEAVIDAGTFERGDVRRYWLVAMDEDTCEWCLSIPELNPEGVGMDEDFDSEEGPVFAPTVHPHCRCSIAYRNVPAVLM